MKRSKLQHGINDLRDHPKDGMYHQLSNADALGKKAAFKAKVTDDRGYVSIFFKANSKLGRFIARDPLSFSKTYSKNSDSAGGGYSRSLVDLSSRIYATEAYAKAFCKEMNYFGHKCEVRTYKETE